MNDTLMNTDRPSRRGLLRAGLAWAALPCVPALARPTQTGRTLVLLHLSGGNDGLNTLIPHADPLYHELRPRLSRAARDMNALDGRVGLHASLASLVPMFRRGRVAIIQGVGYPSPDYSHVGSCRIWSTGCSDAPSQRGWWDTVVERLPGRAGARAVAIGDQTPAEMVTPGLAQCLAPGESTGKIAKASNPLPYSAGGVARTLKAIARVVGSSHPPALVFASVGGFDTHEDQLAQHAAALRELGDGLAAFQRDIDERSAAERVLLAAWSEFGRRPAENAAGGTDHGSAGPVLLIGRKVRGGLYGRTPSLRETDFGNLIPTMDFRAVYSALARHWLGLPTGEANQPAPPMGLS